MEFEEIGSLVSISNLELVSNGNIIRMMQLNSIKNGEIRNEIL